MTYTYNAYRLLALLGERFAQQFLAESFTIWDHIRMFRAATLGQS